MSLVGITDLGDRAFRVDSFWGTFTVNPSDDSLIARDVADFCAWALNGGRAPWEARIAAAREEAARMSRMSQMRRRDECSVTGLSLMRSAYRQWRAKCAIAGLLSAHGLAADPDDSSIRFG